MNINKCTIFMHDIAPCHRSQKVKNYLMAVKVIMLMWPEDSSDLNPMENLSELLRRKVADKQLPSAISLVDAMKNVRIKEITPQYSQNLISSMLCHIKAVIQNKGRLTQPDCMEYFEHVEL